MKRNRWRVSWSDLPVEVTRLIAGHLQENTQDLGHFRAACKKWRHATTLSSILPHHFKSCPRIKLFCSSISFLRPRSSPSSDNSPWMINVVESTKGNIQFSRPFCRTPLIPANNLDFDRFRCTELDIAYHLAYENADNDKDDDQSSLHKLDKVLLCSTESFVRSVEDCVVLGLHRGGRLGRHILDEDEVGLRWIEVKHRNRDWFDDIIMYKGEICAVDRQGKVHKIDEKSMEVSSTLVDSVLISRGRRRKKPYRRRFVGSSAGEGKLYLVERASEKVLKVHKLCESGGDQSTPVMWVEVKDFGERVLFVTRHHCFFTAASQFTTCNLKNCVVFSDDAFPTHARGCWENPKPEVEITVFQLGGRSDDNFKPISSFTDFPMMLWSCPPWISDVASSPSQSQREHEEQHMQIDANSQNGASSFAPEPQEETIEVPSTSTLGGEITRTCTMNEHVAEEASHLKTSGKRASHSVSRTYATSVAESNISNTSTANFEGLDIRTPSIPTLQKIWSKHGNIAETCILRSGNMIAKNLESLACMVQILEGHSVLSLSQFQVDELSDTLFDMRLMGFKVDWIIPYVEKVVRLHKSKPQVDILKRCSQLKAQAEDRRSKLLKEMAEVDKLVQGLEEDMANVSQAIYFSGEEDFDRPVGAGLS